MGDTHDQNNTGPDNGNTDPGVSDDDARQLLDVDKNGRAGNRQTDDDDEDPKGADQLGDAGQKALESIKEQRRAAREERDKYKREFEAAQAKLQKIEDQGKSETQRLQEAHDSFRTRAEKAELALKRREIAEEHAPDHATSAQIRAVAKRLTGDSDEDMVSDAQELYALIAPAPAAKAPITSKPKERLRGGGDPSDDDDETDPIKLAARIPRAR